ALALDVLHAHHPFLLGPTARRLARRAGRPLIFTYHTRYEKYAHYVPLRRGFVEAAAVRLSTRFADSADAVIAPSEAVRAMLVARGVRRPVVVRPTRIDVRPFSPGYARAARADLVRFASEAETQGLVLAEAAACGVPAVAVSAPGCDEVIRDGETGVLAKADAASLGEAAVGLLVDADRRRRMSRRAREIAERE